MVDDRSTTGPAGCLASWVLECTLCTAHATPPTRLAAHPIKQTADARSLFDNVCVLAPQVEPMARVELSYMMCALGV